MKRGKIIVLAAVLLMFSYFIPKAVYADNVWFSADCGHPGGQDQDCICVTKNCPNGDATNGCTPDMGPNPSAETMQKIENMYGCSNPPPTSAPDKPGVKPSCTDPGSSALGSANKITCALQWAFYRQYLATQQVSPTPTVTLSTTPTLYIPKSTPTPTPSLLPTPKIMLKHKPIQVKVIHKNFIESLFGNIAQITNRIFSIFERR
ncbi:MAG TPA: hypothetical protein VMR41_02970 [Patescibacteria group bacterium]|jgi:hypothetical protein|nr:hypothetical protein [Patescibacteria group bacterium]